MFCGPGLAFCGNVGVGSRFHVLRSRTRFQRYCGRQLRFSSLARMNSFSAVPTASGPIFMFCVPRHFFDGVVGVGSRFHVLRPRTLFRQFLGRRVPLSCFARPYSFSAVLRASGPDLKFCVLVVVFGCTEGVWSCFHVLRSRTHFRWYRGRRLPFSCFASPDSFLAVPRASSPVFLFYAPGLIFGGVESVESPLHVLCSRSRFPFSCFALPNSFWRVPRA
jgi:hypothetical protein